MVGRLTAGKASMTLTSNCKVSDKYWGKGNNEEELIFQTGDLVTGVMDKAQYGKFGMVHGVQVSSHWPHTNLHHTTHEQPQLVRLMQGVPKVQ